MNLLNGTCKCALVKFQVNVNKIKTIVNCHCNQCQGMNGSAFSTYAAVLDDGFTMICGSDKLKSYQVTTNAQKCFCTNCGTPIYNTNPKYNGLKIVYYGTIQELKDFAPKTNLYCESKLDWVDQLNSIESFLQTRT